MISGLIMAVGGAISTVANAVGTAIAATATALITKLPTVLVTAKVVVNSISNVISNVANSLGIAPKDEKLDELGAKALQTGTRPKMEDETTQEYLDYLRKDVKLDSGEYIKKTGEEKVACTALGVSMVSEAIEEKMGVELPVDFLMMISKSKLKYEQVEKFIHAFADNGIRSMGEMTKYIENDLSETRAEIVGGIIKDSLKEQYPSLEDSDVLKEIIEMKRLYNEE